VRANVTFGREFDQERFDMAMEASQMQKDLNLFAKGDLTTIGERGVNISGGQKARLSLARAVYSDADIYLLDDPLSAVDPQVANDIFNHCVKGVLKDKCVILVTHQLQFIKDCEQILVLEDGKQKVLGSYAEIQEKGLDIEAILSDYSKMMNKDKVKE